MVAREVSDSLATLRYFYFIKRRFIPAPILHKGWWLNVRHLDHTDATRGGCTDIIPITLLAYCSAIYSKYGLVLDCIEI